MKTNIYTVRDFPYAQFEAVEKCKRPAGNPKTKDMFWFKNALCAFDIETTSLCIPAYKEKTKHLLECETEWHESRQAVMYVWQFYVEGIGVVIGRTWEEFVEFLDTITGLMGSDERLMVLVHNLSYEFQFLRGIFKFKTEDVFCVKARKILKASLYNGKIEFRCSYLQTNMSLDAFTRAMGVEHAKEHDFDYEKKRFYDTPLSESEMRYIINDVVGLVEAFRVRLEQGHDTLYSVPLTSTGYCRRDAKDAVLQNTSRKKVQDILPDYDTYSILHDAFRGGNTHASRFYAGVTLHNVHSVDRASSYPDVLLNRKFPISRFYNEEEPSIGMLEDLISRGRAVVFRAHFEGLRVRDYYEVGCPYIPLSKCGKMSANSREIDNGRILYAEKADIAMTDVDWEIVKSQYQWDTVEITEIRHARYGYLPSGFRELVREYFRRKTALKNVEGEELAYRHAKELINALYGMTAQDVSKGKMLFLGDCEESYALDDSKPAEAVLEENQRRSFLSYAVGVWTTAWARYELQMMIDTVGDMGFVYCDTDSVKYVGEYDWSAYNDRVREESKRNRGFADDPSGVTHYLGVAEAEHDMVEFKTLGAKKYAYREEEGGDLKITIAGVGKKIGGKELDRAGGLDAMKEGFVFYDAGGLESIYNDRPRGKYIRHDGNVVRYTSNVYLQPSTYEIGLAGEYRLLLSEFSKRGSWMYH